MPLLHKVEGCLGQASALRADRGNARHLPRAARAAPRPVRQAYAAGSLPLLRVPEWRDDIPRPARHSALAKDAERSSFSAPAARALAARHSPNSAAGASPATKAMSSAIPTHALLRNLDARTLDGPCRAGPPTTRFIVISRSGIIRDLVQTIAAIEAVRERARGRSQAFPRPDRARARTRPTACATFAKPCPFPRSHTIPDRRPLLA